MFGSMPTTCRLVVPLSGPYTLDDQNTYTRFGVNFHARPSSCSRCLFRNSHCVQRTCTSHHQYPRRPGCALETQDITLRAFPTDMYHYANYCPNSKGLCQRVHGKYPFFQAGLMKSGLRGCGVVVELSYALVVDLLDHRLFPATLSLEFMLSNDLA